MVSCTARKEAPTGNRLGYILCGLSPNHPRKGMTMKHLLNTLAATCTLMFATSVAAQTVYNTVPADDVQYRQCLRYAATLYEGGKEPSPIRGQTKEQAWCTCLWNETPDEFNGNLVKFSESARGKRVNKICEAYSNWSD
jgi:hypothetical protein